MIDEENISEMTTYLDELNFLLKKTKLDIPEYARQVHPNGKNYKWLKKNLTPREDVPERIKELLSWNLNQLIKEKESCPS